MRVSLPKGMAPRFIGRAAPDQTLPDQAGDHLRSQPSVYSPKAAFTNLAISASTGRDGTLHPEYAAIQSGRRDGYTGLEFVAMDCPYSPPMRPKDRRGMSTDREVISGRLVLAYAIR
jgi:hypothetical protein